MSKAQNLGKLATNLPESGIVPIIGGGTGAVTASAALTALGAGGATLKISSIAVTDSSYAVLDDTAVDVAGGYIKITGTGFASGCQVIVNQTLATSATYISATEVRAQLPATTAGTYIVYVVNTDGAVAIRINGVTFSALPAWTTGSTLPDAGSDVAISIQLAAVAATTYTVAAGSTLPTGLTLSSTGLLSGAVAGTSEVTYNFTVVATDAEAQDSPKAFSIIITVGEPYFRNTVLLLTGDGVNAGTNNTFLDSSTNNFAVTRVGTPTQGSISPFSPTRWSGYFSGTGDYLSLSYNSAFNLGTGSFTWEAWIYPTNISGIDGIYSTSGGSGPNPKFVIHLNAGTPNIHYNNLTGGSDIYTAATSAVVVNTWTHLAFVRNGSTWTWYINGVVAGTGSNSTNITFTTQSTYIGYGGEGYFSEFNGYISNLRVVKGTAVYTTNFTPSLVPLTAIANTSLLTLQDNRFKDNSTNALAITTAGTPSIQALSPFAPTAAYNASVHGGSMYFNGTTDYLTVAADAAFDFGTGDFTVESWVYPISNGLNYPTFLGSVTGWSAGASGHRFNNVGHANKFWFGFNGSSGIAAGDPFMTSTNTFGFNTWHHYAVTRSGNTFRMFVNGVLENTQTFAGSYNVGLGGLRSGRSTWDGVNGYFTGYTSNLRLVKGTAVYTANFTPPTAPVTAITNTSLLLNGTNAAIYDATAKNDLITVGDAKISTAVKKFGTGSISFDGTGDYLSIPSSPLLILNESFTIEFWINFTALPTNYIALIGGTTANTQLFITTKSSGQGLRFGLSGVAEYAASSQVWAIGTWYHVALVRNVTNVKFYVNGTNVSDSTYTNGTTYSGVLQIGGNITSVNDFNGYIDDLRITKGVARYTANFTPPVAAHILK